jgi:hypothetical protein
VLKRYLDAKVAEMEREALEEHLSRARREEHFSNNEKSSSRAVEMFLPDFGAAVDAAVGLDLVSQAHLHPAVSLPTMTLLLGSTSFVSPISIPLYLFPQ